MIRDLIPWNWNRSRNLPLRHDEDIYPFLTLHREMNRLFDEAFRAFDLALWVSTGSWIVQRAWDGRRSKFATQTRR